MEKEPGSTNLPYDTTSNTGEIEEEYLNSGGSARKTSFDTELDTSSFDKDKDELLPLTVRFNPETYSEIERIADEEGISLASAVRFICGVVLDDIANPGPVLREIIENMQRMEKEIVQRAALHTTLDNFCTSTSKLEVKNL